MSYVLTICYPSAERATTATYAAKLATTLQCPLRLVHSYNIPYVIGEFPVPVMMPDDQRQVAQEQLEHAVTALRAGFPELDIRPDLGYGIPADVLAEAVEKEKPLVVVLGNDEATSPETWTGIDTAALMAEIEVPLLALPPAGDMPGISRVCLALSREQLLRSTPLEGLEPLQRGLRFKLSVLTVADGDADREGVPLSPLMQQLEAAGAVFTTIGASGEDLGSQLAAAARDQGADCLAVLKHDRGFWSALFHKGHTEAILRETKLPVLAFHALPEKS